MIFITNIVLYMTNCILHQRKYQSVILFTIKVVNIGTDGSDPDQTPPNNTSSLIRVYTDLLFHLHLLPVYAFTAIK